MDMSLLKRAVPIRFLLLGATVDRLLNSQFLRVAIAQMNIDIDLGFDRDGDPVASLSSSQCAAILNETVAQELTIWANGGLTTSKFLASLEKQTQLKRLTLFNGPFTSLAFLRALPQLRKLQIEHADIKNFDALDGLTELEVWVNEDVKSKLKFRSGRGPKMHYVKQR